jgi:ribosomal protein S18 acetylase RimI-like enzyme
MSSPLIANSTTKRWNLQNRMASPIIRLSLLVLLLSISTTLAFSLNNAPISVFGLGALLFPSKLQLKSTSIQPARGDIRALLQASDFFVDAFWTGKVGGGATELSDRQQRQLSSLQFAEFRKRYAGVTRGQAELILCYGEVAGSEDEQLLIGCAGMEVQEISPPMKGGTENRKNSISNPIVMAPLMSNVAVSRDYRRRGVGEALVKEAENIARYQWGFTDMYLFVEQRNKSAIKLYQKLGYSKLWVDPDAKTLLPSKSGKLEEDSTTIVCMRKRLELNAVTRVLFSILGR